MDDYRYLEFSLRTKIALAEINCERHSTLNFLKPLQGRSIKSALTIDTVVVLPTGYGKSLIYEVLPKIFDTKIVIVSPLNSIIEEQSAKLGDRAVTIDWKLIQDLEKKEPSTESENERVKRFLDGNAVYIMGHPEFIMEKTVCKILRNKYKDIAHIVVDEAQCVVSWGHDFRPQFSQISKFKSLFPNAKFVALTATATVKMQKEIAENLCMSKNFHTISSNTIRANIKLNVSKRCASTGGHYTAEESFETCLKPVISELCLQFQNFDRTIVYSKLKYCAMGFELVRREAMKLSLEDVSQVMNAVSQYHAPSTTKMKEKTVHKMCDPSSQLKLLFATEAYSMGTDAPNIRRIIHFGPPSSLETYLQEIGRGGRDGAQCIATLFYNASDIGSNVKNMKEEVKQFCALKTCRR